MKKFPAWLALLLTLLLAVGCASFSLLLQPSTRSEYLPVYILTFFAGFVFSLFVFVCLLKRKTAFLPNLLLTIGVFGFSLFRILNQNTDFSSKILQAFGNCFIGILAIASALSVEKEIKRVPVRRITAIITGICGVLAVIQPFIPKENTEIFGYVLEILYGIVILSVIGLAFYSSIIRKNAELLANPVIACLLVATVVYFPSKNTGFFSPDFLLCILILLVTLLLGVKEFVLLERQNAYLTKNMQAEINRQTKELQTILSEREKVFRFLSHNMRKPVISVQRFLSAVRTREENEKQIQALDIITSKVDEIEKDINELSKYARFTYSVEQSDIFSVEEVMRKTYESLKPDCDANGIVFSVEYAEANIFAKKQQLSSILLNLVVNAIEHADCSEISLSACTRQEFCLITVSDNGTGIDQELAASLFGENIEPECDREHGIGLYFCKNYVEAMNGKLEYIQANGKSTFLLTLPLV